MRLGSMAYYNNFPKICSYYVVFSAHKVHKDLETMIFNSVLNIT